MNERLQNTTLFLLPAFIWGSTWFVIKFQLGIVDPIFSVAYRFFIAGFFLLFISAVKRLNLRFSIRSHFFFALQGLCLFGINYWLVYLAELILTSGLVAVIFSLIVFTNMIFSALILKTRITVQIFLGGMLAIAGTILIFKKEFSGISNESDVLLALVICFISLILASLGNVLSGYNQRNKLPVVQSNAYGMIYGAMVLLILGLLKGARLTFDTSIHYVASISYLAIFGSVIAFTAYLSLLGKIGPSRASYVVVVVPILAMILSTIFEDYEWQSSALVGMPILILGNLVAMNKIKLEKLFAQWK